VSGVMLVVDGEPADWLLPYSDPCPCEREHRSTVRIDGPPPTVDCQWCDECLLELRDSSGCLKPRPLRAGDKVALATAQPWDKDAGAWVGAVCDPHPFATATVARVEPRQDYMESSDRLVWLVTVSDVEALS
jgi:hypothetical protein